MNINSLSVVKYHKRKRRKYELFVYISGAIICIAFIKFMHWNANRLQIPSVLPERIKDAWIASIIFTGLTFFILWAGIRFMVWKKCSYHKVLPQLSHERLMEIESDTQQSGIHAHLIKLYSGSRHESPPYTTLLLAVYGRVLFYQNGFYLRAFPVEDIIWLSSFKYEGLKDDNYKLQIGMRNKEFIVLSIPSIYKNNYIISLGNKIKECNPNAFVTIGGNEMEILKKVRKTEEYKYVENLFFGNKTR